jgi:hypothetical protein
MTAPNPRFAEVFNLEYPQSIGVFDTYQAAQKVVDFLSDKEFPVENLCIVGTDLKSVERVTGRQTWGSVLLRGVQSGVSTGLMIAIFMLFFSGGQDYLQLLLGAVGIGVAIGVVMSTISHLASRGKRDFTSVSQTVATRYEVLCEHKVAGKARELIANLAEVRAQAFTNFPPHLGYQYPPPSSYPQAAQPFPQTAQPFPQPAPPGQQPYPQPGQPYQPVTQPYQTPGQPTHPPAQ